MFTVGRLVAWQMKLFFQLLLAMYYLFEFQYMLCFAFVTVKLLLRNISERCSSIRLGVETFIDLILSSTCSVMSYDILITYMCPVKQKNKEKGVA